MLRQPGSPGGHPGDPRNAQVVRDAPRPQPYGVPAGMQGQTAVALPGSWPTSANAGQPQPTVTLTAPPMGSLYTHILHPIFGSVWERMYRTQPNASFHTPTRSPQNPYKATIGSFEVPRGQALIIQEVGFSAAKPSGTTASDTIPLEPERGATLWGFDITVDEKRERQTEYELDPVPAADSTSSSFVPGSRRTPSATFFNRNRASQFGLAVGSGKGTLPFRPGRYGPKTGPFTIQVPAGSTVQVSVVIFRPIPFPLAYVQADLSGYFLPVTLLEKFNREMTP